MKCKRCGRDNPENAQRCMYCNAPLTNKPQNSKKGDKKLIGTIIALILVFACVAGTFAYQQYWPHKKGFRSAGGGAGGFGSLATGGGSSETIVAENPVTIDGNDPEVEINFFTADTFDILVGSTHDVKFTAEIFSENELAPTDLVVTDGAGNSIGYMNDDGADGDATAGDGIYTLVAQVNSNMRKALTYTLRAKDAVSNALKLFFYTDITADDFTFYKETVAKIVEINEPLGIQQLLMGNSGIKACTVSTDRKQVKIEFNSGITCVWEDDTTDGTQLKGTSATNRVLYSDYTGVADQVRQANLSSAVADGDVYVLRPYRSSDFRYDDFKTAGKIIADTLDGELVVRDNEKANLDAFKAFGDYGTILIDSHGKLDYDGNPAIVTGVSYTSADSFSSADWQSKRLHVSISKASGARVAIDGDFFDRYYADHSLDGASIYLGTCHSMANETIANALIKKGAKVVYGFSNSVTYIYCNDILKELYINQHLLGTSNVKDAYTNARQTCGQVDPNNNKNCELLKKGDNTFIMTTYAGRGTAVGRVANAEDGSNIKNALVRIYKDGGYVASVRTDASGKYSKKLAAGDYVFKISKAHYKSAKIAVTIDKNVTVYNETSLMMRVGITSGFANGVISDALSGEAAASVYIQMRKSWNNRTGAVVHTTTTNDSGYYEIRYTPGYYTIEYSKEGYITAYKNIVIGIVDFRAQNAVISPEMPDDGNFRVVLSWSNAPKDLDSHLTGPNADGSRFHLYYRFANTSNANANADYYQLDLDNTDIVSYPHIPETTTIVTQLDGTYRYSVHDFTNGSNSGSTALSNSNATVNVYKGSVLVATFHVPTGIKGTIWTVFELNGNEIKPINKFSSGSGSNIGNF